MKGRSPGWIKASDVARILEVSKQRVYQLFGEGVRSASERMIPEWGFKPVLVVSVRSLMEYAVSVYNLAV